MTYTARPSLFLPTSVSGCRLWLDGGDASTFYTTNVGPVTPVAAPTDIAGCVGWWDASDAASITQSGGLVSQWNDKSGQGNHATASGTARPTTGTRTVGGKNAIDFDGSAAVMSAAGVSAVMSGTDKPATVFVVVAPDSLLTNSIVTAWANTSSPVALLQLRTNGIGWAVAKRDDSVVSKTITSTASSGVAAQIVSAAISGTTASIYQDGAAALLLGDVDVGVTTTNTFYIAGGGADGSVGRFDGVFAEVIIFNTALSTADRARVESYLAAKWGIANVHAQSTTTGAPIGYWGDKSGNNNHFIQVTSVNRPTRGLGPGRPALDFVRTSSTVGSTIYASTSMAAQFLTAGTAFVAFKPNTGALASYSVFETHSNPTNYSWTYTNSTGLGHYGMFRANRAYSVAATTSPQLLSAVGHILRAQSTTGLYKVYRCGKLLYEDSNTYNGANNYSAGNTYSIANTHGEPYYTGQHFELLLYDNIVSEENCKKIEAYLADKWNIPLVTRNAPTVFGPLTRVSNVVSNAVTTAVPTSRSRLLKAYTSPANISGLELWLDAADLNGLYTTDQGEVSAVSSPTAVTGLAAWWDASDTASVVLSGSNVTQWNDKSGNNRNLIGTAGTQPTYGLNAVYNKPAISFNGTSQFLSIASSDLIQNLAGYTVFVVFWPTSTTGDRICFSAMNTAGTSVLLRLGSTGAQAFSGGRQFAADSFAQVTSTYAPISTYTNQYILSSVVSHTARTLNAAVNGMTYGTATGYGAAGTSENNPALITVGAQNTTAYTSGAICEILVYNSALSPADRVRVERYLSQKWSARDVHVPAIDNNQPVGYWRDKSGKNRHVIQAVPQNRPLRAYFNDKPVLSFSGGNVQSLYTSNPADWTFMHNGSPNTIFVVGRWTGGASVGSLIATGTTGTSTGFDTLLGSSSPYFRYGVMNNSSGPNVVDNSHGVPSANQWAIFRVESNISAATTYAARSAIYFNGVGQGQKNTQIGSPASTAPSNSLWIGARPGPNASLTGNIAEVLVFSKLLSVAETAAVEQYLANKWSIQLAPTVTNTDAQDWIRRAYLAGGTVDQTTATAVNTFCSTIDAAGLRSKFGRLNLLCGDNIYAATVPLYLNWKTYAGRNILSGSDTFTTNWATSDASVIWTTAAGPVVGTARAIVEAANSNQHHLSQGVGTALAPTGSYTASCYFKAGTRSAAFIQMFDGANNNVYAYFNLSSPSATYTQYGTGTVTASAAITTIGSGWYRCRLSFTGAGQLNAGSGFRVGTADLAQTGANRHYPTGDNTSTALYVWGAQLELGATMTDYDPAIIGNAQDTATNYASNSYQHAGAAGGLLGTASSSYINTGAAQNHFNISDRHLSVYEAAPTPTVTYATLISSATAGSATTDWFIGYASPPTTVRYSGLGNSAAYAVDAATNSSDSFLIGTNTGTAATLYKNGAAAGSASATSVAVTNTSNIVVGAVAQAGNSQNINSRLRAYSVGLNLTAAEVATYTTAMHTFQQAIGRSLVGYPNLHADARDWYSRVINVGGAASETTLRAVSNFCSAIETAGLRERIYRLNLFAGDNLQAAVVPLYCGPVNGWATKNLIGLNEHFSRWILSNTTVTSNAIAAPNGTMTADLIVENATTANNYGVRQNFDMAANTTYTLSIYAKKKDLRYLQLNCYNGQNSGAYFDLDNGVVAGTFGTASNHTITSAGNGWWRCALTITNTTATNDRPIYVLPTSVSNDSGHIGVVGAGTYLWGAQLEVGTLTSYAPRCHGGLLDVNTGYAATDYTLAGGFNANTTSGTKHLVLSDKPLRSIIPDLGWSTQGGHMASTFATNATWSGNRRTLNVFQNINSTGGSYGFLVSNNGSQSGNVSGTWGANGTQFTFTFDNTYRHFILSRTSNTLFRMYLNGAYQTQTTNNTTTYLNTKTRLASGTSFFDNSDGLSVEAGPYETWPGRIADYSVGMSLDDTQAANLAAAFTAFRTAIGRV